MSDNEKEYKESLNNAAQTIQPISNAEQLSQFLLSLDKIKAMPEADKYYHAYLIVCKFLDLVGTDNNMIAGIAFDLILSAALGECRGNTLAASQEIKTKIIPYLIDIANSIDQSDTVNIMPDKKPSLFH